MEKRLVVEQSLTVAMLDPLVLEPGIEPAMCGRQNCCLCVTAWPQACFDFAQHGQDRHIRYMKHHSNNDSFLANQLNIFGMDPLPGFSTLVFIGF